MKPDDGNALFLILIAVALFAALSYAVTTSGRGGGSVDKEQALIDASQISQAGTAVANTVTRLILTGTAVADLQYCSTAAGTCSIFDGAVDPCSSGNDCIFATDGGGVQGDYSFWTYNHDYTHAGIGTSAADVGSYKFMSTTTIANALSLCEQINKGILGSSTVPIMTNSGAEFSGYAGIEPIGAIDNTAGDCASCEGEPFMCFDLNSSPAVYVYHHILVEQ